MSESTRPENSESAVTDEQIKASRKKLLMIFACFGIPLVLATIWLQIVRYQGGTWGNTSRGELIHPAVPITEFSLPQFVMKNNTDKVENAYREAVENFDLDGFRGTWSVLYMPTGACGEVCELNLYHMRQVRLALNNRMTRVQRVALMESEGQFSEQLLSQHLGLHVLGGTDEAVSAFRGQIQAAEAEMEALPDAIYVVDPFGNVMMRFPPDLDPGKMLKDLKHLLKVSRIG